MDGPTYTITVTPEHIRKGVPRHPCGCPVKLAIEAAGFTVVRVASRVMWARDPEGWDVLANLPRGASDAIYRLDMHKLMEPFTFELTVQRFARTRAAVNAGVAA